MNIAAEIVPGFSLAGISLGANIDTVGIGLLEAAVPFEESTFYNFGRAYTMLRVLSGVVTVVANDSGRVTRLGCGLGYAGKYAGIFYPGISVKQICEASSSQLAIHGFLVVNNEFGAIFDIPEIYEGVQYDDIDDVSQLPQEMTLNELEVVDREWWR